jgi:partner of Y14 and mago protein
LPPEDVEKYKNRTAESFRNRGKGGVLGAELVDEANLKDQSASASKNAKRREARKKAAADKKDEDLETKSAPNGANGKANPPTEVDAEVARQKEVRKLVKKLRQAKELKDKKESGSALLPEQFEKVIKINELIRQLESLGVDADGKEKDGAAKLGKATEP